MKETAVTFGKQAELLGVMTEPESPSSQTAPPPPALIVLNAGLLHKVGPNRLSVELARAVAKSGFRVLRFDLSGIGDSKMTSANVPMRERAIRDVQAAMNFVAEHHGIDRFLLAGLCSGSDNAHHTSLHDERVVGSIHLDGYCVKNAQYYAKYYGGRLLSWRVLRSKLQSHRKTEAAEGQRPTPNARTREFPSLEQLTDHFTVLSSRGVRFLCIYTGESGAYNHKGQLREALYTVPFGDLLDEEFYPLAAHTFTSLASRRRVVMRVAEWLVQHWGPGRCGPRSGTAG